MPAKKRKGPFFSYLVRCGDGSLYAGCTNDLERRLSLHNSGKGAKCVRGRLPARLVYAKRYRMFKSALKAERSLKKLSKMQKEALVRSAGEQFVHPLSMGA